MNHYTLSEQMIKPVLKRILTASICTGLVACGSLPSMDEVFPDRKNDYKETQEIPSLEVPPGLSGATLTSDQMPVRRRTRIVTNDQGFDSPYDPQPTLSDVDADRATVYGDDAAYQESSDTEYLASEDSVAMAIPLEDYPLDDSEPAQAAAEDIQHYVLNAEVAPPYIQSDQAYPTVWEATGKAIALAGYQIVDSKPDSGAYYILNEYQPQAEKSDKGLLSSLAFWRDDEQPQAEPQPTLAPDAKYVIRVIAAEQGARIELQDLGGQAMSGPDAASLLGDINWQLQ